MRLFDTQSTPHIYKNSALLFAALGKAEPTTLTYNHNLTKVNVNPHAKNKAHRLNSLAVRVSADGQTQPSTLFPCFAKLRG